MIINTSDGNTKPKEIGIEDYVVEEGIKDGWYYRKWSSGKAECWNAVTWKSGNWLAWGSQYYSENYSPQVTFPFAFVKTPDVYTNYYPYLADGWAAASVTASTPEKLGRFYVIRPASNINNCDLCISVYVVGRWK